MTPLEYLQSYQTLKIVDDELGIKGTAKIVRYQQGWCTDNGNKHGYEKNNNTEWCAVKDLLQRKFSPPKTKSLPAIFKITGSDKMDPTEEFYAGSLHRAYENRASPDEIVDATRLAVLVGRVTPEKAIQYAEDLFALDCNTFVGNYLGISPSTAIFAYVNGYGTKNPSGATPDVIKSMALVKCPPRSDPEKITAEDILVSYDPSKKEWTHIALVNGIKLDKAGKGGEITATVDICEWGTAGDLSKHHNTAKPTLIVGKSPVSSTVDVVGWKTDKGGMRYFLDGSAFTSVPARGWGILADAKGTISYDV